MAQSKPLTIQQKGGVVTANAIIGLTAMTGGAVSLWR
jgi:hypothetical protein